MNQAMGDAGRRLELVDALRGFALLGLFLVHCIELFELYWAHPAPGPVFDWVFGLFAGKSYALFALCFGLSFYLIMHGAAQRGEDFRGRFAWRLALLLTIGLLHGLVYRGDILQILALLGLSMLLFDRIGSNKLLLALAALCFLQLPLLLRAWAASQGADWAVQSPLFLTDTTMPALTDGSLADALRANLWSGLVSKWSYYAETGRLMQILGLFLLGLVLGRIGFFDDLLRHARLRRIWLAAAAVAAMLFYASGEAALDAIAAEGSPARAHLEWALDCWTALAVLSVQVLLLVELFQTAARPVLQLLAAPGRMTLTLYVGQSLVFVPIFYGFGLGLHDDLSLAQSLWIGLAAFALQILFARWWFRYFRYGPLEWIWRAGTRTTLAVPFACAARPSRARLHCLAAATLLSRDHDDRHPFRYLAHSRCCRACRGDRGEAGQAGDPATFGRRRRMFGLSVQVRHGRRRRD
jgi:uncharacterized protein